nr:MAG TPA: hypothetical protein [Caudoviricetes sp.]DAH28989.1 MAG TPA: hypothetical protein [Caudoviricetes sp.]DAP12204.1 MAG TPA: hypothetical protein [Caudoviricetes sp.]DAP52146.1 MAG TPA: hypothetical protein [Caudoviricetes sp.]
MHKYRKAKSRGFYSPALFYGKACIHDHVSSPDQSGRLYQRIKMSIFFKLPLNYLHISVSVLLYYHN